MTNILDIVHFLWLKKQKCRSLDVPPSSDGKEKGDFTLVDYLGTATLYSRTFGNTNDVFLLGAPE
jgi:hypothetical protein